MGYNLIQTNPAYELVSDIVVGTATTSVDFTGLNFGKTDDLMLVSDLTNVSGTSSNYKLYVNNNQTATNYYVQNLRAYGTSYDASRVNSSNIAYTANSNKSFSTIKMKLSNNGYFVALPTHMEGYATPASMLFTNWAYTSTFTMSSITQITIRADVANAIGAGSRFQLYKRKAPIIADIIVSTSTTSVDFTGLTFDKGSEYMLVSTGIDNSSSNFALISVNGNTTSTNYYSQRLEALTTTVASGRANSNWLGVISNAYTSYITTDLKLTNDGQFTWQTNNCRGAGSSAGSYLEIEKIHGSSTFTTPSITSIRLSGTTFGIGSRFQLIKLK